MSSDGASMLADDVAVSVRGLGKCYHIYDSPRDRLKQALLRRWKRYYRPFWAIRDVSFELKRGEALGIVGRNGSGKSTLLQILAGTLTPTAGEARIRGRIAALLELTAGFNPEFTGRENVFLKGAILGLSRRQMLDRFDEIAAFADIGQFLDQPVKSYSSGMRARLAFAVAVCVEPDVLILDEILSVGDVGFKQKCVSRMRQLLDTGVTLLLVSHSPDSVKSMCDKGLYLERGRRQFFGSAEETVDRYVATFRVPDAPARRPAARKLPRVERRDAFAPGTLRYGSGEARIVATRLLGTAGAPEAFFRLGERMTLEIEIEATRRVRLPDVGFVVRDDAGVDLFGTFAKKERTPMPAMRPGQRARARFTFENPLSPGSYGITLTVLSLPGGSGTGRQVLDHVDAGLAFRVLADPDRRVRHKMHVPVRVETERLADGPGAVAPSEDAGAAHTDGATT